MNRVLGFLLTTAFAIALPLAVISTVVLGLVHDAGFYHDGEVRYRVDLATGLPQDVHDRINLGIVRFFEGTESLPNALRATAAPPDVFSQKEILHMNDVREVIRFFGSIQVIAGVVCLVTILIVVSRWRQGGRQFLSRALVVSAIGTFAVGLVVAAITFFAFDSLFLFFHKMTFHNDFWELDPRTDHLIQMFPFEFWYDAMVLVSERVLGATVLSGLVGVLLGRMTLLVYPSDAKAI